MNCTINDLQLSFDSEGKLRNTIGRVTGFSVNKAYALASFFRDLDFKKFLLGKITQEDIIKNQSVDFNNFTENDYVKIKQNKLGAILNLYYIEKYHSVANSKTHKGMGRLNGFTSATAKEIAKNYVAALLRTEYSNEILKDKTNRRTAVQIIDDVNKKLLITFYNNYVSPFADYIINSDKYSKEAKDAAVEYIRITSELESLQKVFKEAKQKNENLRKEFSSIRQPNARSKEIIEELKKLNKVFTDEQTRALQLTTDRYIIAQNLVNLYSSNYDNALKIRLRNFSNLIAQSRGDINAWYFQVFHSKNMNDAYKFFNNIDNIEDAISSLEIDEDSIIDRDDDQGINKYAREWTDSFYKSFEQSVNGALRMELSNIPVLSQPYNYSSNVQAIDTDNELGVPTYMNPQSIIAQIHAVGNFNNLNSFIRSIENLAKSRPSFYGLGQIVAKMKQNKQYANFVFVNFAKPVFNKTIMTINSLSKDGDISFDYSNPSAFPLTELVYRLSNKIKATYDISYNEKDASILIGLQKELTSDKGFNKEQVLNKLHNILTNYFPNFDKNVFSNYITSLSDENFNTEVGTLIREIYAVVDGIKQLKDKINSDYVKFQKEQQQKWNDYREAVKTAQKEGKDLPAKPEKEYFDNKNIDLNPTTYKGIIDLANRFLNFTDSRIRLNSTNAEGNSAADIGKNCYISRFFEDILAEDEVRENAGLENLLSYITQGENEGMYNQYANNPLFFGVKDVNGNIIVPGMFTRTSNGIEINPNAKNILKYSLFDGVRNNENNAGAIYASMSKLDFFLTQYLAFTNSTEEIVDGAKTKKIGSTGSAVYSMRIGSDAPKIFFIRAPKYNNVQVKSAIYNHVLNELNMFVNGLSNLFINENGELVLRKDVDGLIGRAYFDEKVAGQIRRNKGTDYTKALVKNGELVGNLFSFKRLFELDSYNADTAIKGMLSLYGGDNANSLIIVNKDGRLSINSNRLADKGIITFANGKFRLNLSSENKEQLTNIVNDWCTAYLKESAIEVNSYRNILAQHGIKVSDGDINSFLLNYVNMNINYDDLFEGDYKYYKDARDFLKRSKESQAGGDGYAGYNILADLTKPIQSFDDEVIEVKTTKNGVIGDYIVPTYKDGQIINQPLTARSGFRAVTIYNTITPSTHADKIEAEIKSLLIKDGFNETLAAERAKKIADGYRSPTTVNDAQSYITIEEFIRRRYADGTLSNYQDILAQLLDDSVLPEEIDLTGINARIQVQKNFYYDKVFDDETGEYYPRQIKNAEFVLIPKLLPQNSELKRIYDWMRANDISQLNTAETSKAAKKRIFTIWDEQTGKFNDNFEQEFNPNYIEEYSYKYLYKQQEVPEHMKDAKNKAGTQFIKKIIDNIDRLDGSNEELNKVANNFLKAYSANITEDFFTFVDDLGWEYDNETGKFYNKEYAITDSQGNKLPKEVIDANKTRLNLDKFYERFREEAVRLGMDSNFMDYLIPTESGQPIMPNFMNNTSTKLESISQAMWNSAITRQTFPGWHAAQITDVGYSDKLNFDPETGVMEVYLPRWSNLIPKGKNAEEDAEILKQIQEEGLDIQIGYRIPTEGKQSISVIKVVGFVNETLGSTIVVPAEWVTQTGSDFDVDSVYGISWEMDAVVENGKTVLKKVPFKDGKVTNEELYISYIKEKAPKLKFDKEESIDNISNKAVKEGLISFETFKKLDHVNKLTRRARNNYIIDAAITIMNDASSREEQYSRSHFEDLSDANDLVDKWSGDKLKKISPYNPLSQLNYFDDAMSGARLKAQSVNWDTTFSKFNRIRAILSHDNLVEVILNKDEYNFASIDKSYPERLDLENGTLMLDRLGWSDNNRNITGNLCTPYISQTTAHHLDAIKKGSIKNVNELTFGVYKLLVGLGLDYIHTIAFIRQPILTELVNNNNLIKSAYFSDSADVMQMTMADIAIKLDLRKDKRNRITKEDNLDTIFKALVGYPAFVETFKNLFNVDISGMDSKKILKLKFPLQKAWLQRRIELAKTNPNPTGQDLLNQAAVDFSVLLTFNRIKSVANEIENAIKVLGIDKIGNKPEVRETRLVMDTLSTLRSHNIIKVGNKNLMDSIFPLNYKKDIVDVNSSYQYLATVMKYVTKPSLETAQLIFTTENADFVEAEKAIEAAIGKKLSTKEYKEFKKYYINYLYNKIAKLMSPLTVNERGEISIDEEILNETKENETYWDNERSRIFGYGVIIGPVINIQDINNPTAEELKEYKKLTPVQKVLFIQKNFNDNQGIFNYLKPTLISTRDISIKGVSRQYLSYDDQIDNIEDLYQLFTDSFSNHNPLIKLAAIDLIKYAFIAEGFNFKSGYITKIITNSSLYESKENGGLDVINGGNNTVTEEIKTLPDEIKSGELKDLYVRSHSDVVKIHRFYPLSKQEIDPYTGAMVTKHPNWTDSLLSVTDKTNGLIYLDSRSSNPHIPGIIAKLKLYNGAEYIKLSIPNREGKYKTNLYKIVAPITETITITAEEYYARSEDYKKFKELEYNSETEEFTLGVPPSAYYLVPLNKLDSTESFKYSYNENNNDFFSQEYYMAAVETRIEENKTANNRAKNVISNAPSTGEKVGAFTGNITQTMDSNPDMLMELYNNADEKLKASIRKFIEHIQGCYNNLQSTNNYGTRVINNSYKLLSSFFPADKPVVQNITLPNGIETKVIITHINLNTNNRRARFIDQFNGNLKLTATDPKHMFDGVIGYMKSNNISPNFAELYKIEFAPRETDEMYSTTELITATSSSDSFARRDKIDQIATMLIDDISYVHRRDEIASGKRFLEELYKLNLDRNSNVSLETNRDPLYKNAARYYRSAANSILEKLNNYQVNEDLNFAIDDPRLYEYLVEHDELFGDIAKTILDAISFGSRIKEILNLNLAAEDKAIVDSVNTIIKAIKDVTQNPKLKGAMNNIFNIYFKKYSTNPEIIEDIIALRETYGDTDQLYRWIADATEIPNSEVQVILKQIYSIFSKAEMFDAKKNVDEYKTALKEIEAMDETMDMNKIIDSDKGIIRQDFNEQFLTDKQKVEDDFREAESELIIAFRDAYSKGDPLFKDIKPAVKKYLINKLTRDKFYHKHLEQPIVTEYYAENIANREFAINNIGDLYFEYVALRMQLYNTNFMPTETPDEAKDRKERVQRRITSLQESIDAAGNLKPMETLAMIERLGKFILKHRDINEKYFNVQEYDGFMEEYKKYNDFITKYNNENENKSLEEKLQNPQYKEAYDWIRTNGRIRHSVEARKKLSDAYEVLTGHKDKLSKRRREAISRIPGAIDDLGVIDARKLSDEQIDLLRQEEETDLSKMYDDGAGEAILIKIVPKDTPIAKRKAKNKEDQSILDSLKYEDSAVKVATITRINEILSKVIDKNTGKIQPALLFNDSIVTDEERNELAELYKTLRSIKKDKSRFKRRANNVFTDEVNNPDYLTMWLYAQNNLKGTRQYQQFVDIFTELNADGELIPNNLLYGYRVPTDEYIDKERTEAIKFLNDNIEYVPTEYYHMAAKEAANKGDKYFDEWFRRNHIYDAFTHKYKPLSVWTESKPKADSYLDKETSYTATFDNMESSVKDEYINPNYRKFSYNYKKGDSRYDSSIVLNAKEQRMKDLLIHTMRKYANTNTTKRFVEEGYLPRERTTVVNGRWALEQGLSLMGLSWHSGRDSDIFRTNIDYSNDFEIDVPMLQLLKGKGTQSYLPLPKRAGKTEEEYQKELKEVKEKNAEIRANNLAIDNANMSKNWLEVMEDFIKSATIHNARANAKPFIYLLMEDLKNNNAYMLKGMWDRKVVKNRSSFNIEDTGYKTIQQKHTQEIVHNMARRLLYDQHHENSVPRSIANFLQNMTSAKYMVFNLYGGIANVLIGKSGILAEEYAGEYFGFNEFMQAEAQYLQHSVSTIASLYTDKANDLTTAIMKKFNIVNVDDMLQLVANSKDLDTRLENIRSAMYSFQSIGEHYMQNSVLLAMMKSNRLYVDSNGVQRIGDLKDYTADIEREAMEAVLADYDYILTNYQLFRKNLKYETQTKYDIISGRKNINRMFLDSLKYSRNTEHQGLYKDIVDKYVAKRKELLESKKSEFLANPTVESLFALDNGYAVIKPEVLANLAETGVNKEEMLEKLLAEFREKVKSVNKYIHGWYDKNAAGMIESKWFGSLVMQYHKHLPIGILKRYRRRGFHSEFRGTKERGFYQTLIDFMGTEFSNFGDRKQAKVDEGTNVALASIQVIFESIINSVVNFNTNKNLLAPWESANLARIGGGLSGALAACLVVLALYGLWDDDEIKDDRWKASLMYLADRLYADNTMYTPVGLVTEYRTAWSSPIASANGPSDLIKAMTIIPQYLFDPEFSRTYETGLYKGKDKLQVLLRRNLPGIRPYDRIMNINRNNQYYKIGDSQLGVSIAKSFGETLNED